MLRAILFTIILAAAGFVGGFEARDYYAQAEIKEGRTQIDSLMDSLTKLDLHARFIRLQLYNLTTADSAVLFAEHKRPVPARKKAPTIKTLLNIPGSIGYDRDRPVTIVPFELDTVYHYGQIIAEGSPYRQCRPPRFDTMRLFPSGELIVVDTANFKYIISPSWSH